ncbi:MAG: class I SAM-dependent methyltransferase [Phycisphaerales bacterium]|nr:class I SAM-dependent methyltransferase [Phycisphaerales bacterium]
MRPTALDLMERGYIPDWLARIGIRRRLAHCLHAGDGFAPQAADVETDLLAAMRSSLLASHTAATYPQREEPSIHFFQRVLGPRLKYSACWWPAEVKDLETAEAAMLALSCERAELGFDQDILELDCGWGALTLWMAEFYPDSRIIAVANTRSQQAFIAARCQERGFNNVQVITANLNDFHPDRYFDRVVSIESFEHAHHDREWIALIHRWLKPGGKLFMHRRSHPHPTDPCKTEQDSMRLEATWHFNGHHYQCTLEAWLANLDRERDEIMRLFQENDDTHQAKRWFQRWRILFMAYAELFGYRDGEIGGISHYRFSKSP